MKNIVLLLIILLSFGCTSQKQDAQDLFNEGASLSQKGNFTAAIRKYQEGLAIDPSDPVGYNLLGMAYRYRFNQTGTQEYKENEIGAFKKAIELDPKFWVAYKNLAVSLYYQGRKKEAVPYLEKALELQPNDPEKPVILRWIEKGKNE